MRERGLRRLMAGVGAVMIMVGGGLAVGGSDFLWFGESAYAVDGNVCDDGSIDAELKEAAGCNTSETVKAPIKSVIETILYATGVICVVMVIVGGARMTMSAGDAGAVTKAKNTIIYAIVGLVVAMLALAIVEFVVGGI